MKEQDSFRLDKSAVVVTSLSDESEEKEYWEAYNYLLTHSKEMKYSEYRRLRLPIGSGVTEAGCKVVFTQRFKESGMTWSLQGGEVILRLRLAVLSGVYKIHNLMDAQDRGLTLIWAHKSESAD